MLNDAPRGGGEGSARKEPQRELGIEDDGEKEKRGKERIEPQHDDNSIAGERPLLGDIVEAKKQRREECCTNPHSRAIRR